MSFIEIDSCTRVDEWSMSRLQSHDYYELYFLLEGTRRFFLEDGIFNITAPTVCIIPPFCLHKTEGGAYKRININVSGDVLSEVEREFLDVYGEQVVFNLDTERATVFLSLLEEASGILYGNLTDGSLTASFVHVLLHLLGNGCLRPIDVNVGKVCPRRDDAVMQAVAYINKHYAERFTVNDVCAALFMSKNSLCAKFRSTMHCSVMEYRSFIRISRAKEFLVSGGKSLEEIAELCGFSSANYFSLIFKKQVGISPSGYRKTK